jgi:hypothetical protein
MNGHSQQLKTFTANIPPCQLLYRCLEPVLAAIFPWFMVSVCNPKKDRAKAPDTFNFISSIWHKSSELIVGIPA